jgi:peptide/nickel transport system substrate-binding protein
MLRSHRDQRSRRRAARGVAVAVSTLAAALALSACGGSSAGGGGGTFETTTTAPTTGGGKPQPGGTLTITTPLEPVTLDPNVGELDAGSQHAQRLIFQQLLEVKPGPTPEIVPGLAEKWNIDPKQETATFHLRAADFSDGTPVTSGDVKFSFERAMDPKIDATEGEVLSELIASVQTPDPRTVVLHLAGPRPALQYYAAIATLSVVSKAAFERLGPEKFGREPVGGGSGPFEIVKWTKGQKIEFARNPHYWKKGLPYLDKVDLRYVPDDNTRILDVRSGRADMADEIPYSQLESLSNTGGVKLVVGKVAAVDAILLHSTAPPLKSQQVRQALNYATPREAIKNVAFAGDGELGITIIPQVKYADPQIKPYPLETEKAKELLAAAGYQNGFTLHLMLLGGDAISNQVATILQSAWGEVGVKLEIQTVDYGTLTSKYLEGEFEAILFPPTAVSLDIPSEDEFVNLFTETFFEEIFGVHNSKLKALREAMESTWSEAERTKIYSEFETEQRENPETVPLVEASSRTLLHEGVEGFEYVALNWWNLESTWLKH